MEIAGQHVAGGGPGQALGQQRRLVLLVAGAAQRGAGREVELLLQGREQRADLADQAGVGLDPVEQFPADVAVDRDPAQRRVAVALLEQLGAQQAQALARRRRGMAVGVGRHRLDRDVEVGAEAVDRRADREAQVGGRGHRPAVVAGRRGHRQQQPRHQAVAVLVGVLAARDLLEAVAVAQPIHSRWLHEATAPGRGICSGSGRRNIAAAAGGSRRSSHFSLAVRSNQSRQIPRHGSAMRSIARSAPSGSDSTSSSIRCSIRIPRV